MDFTSSSAPVAVEESPAWLRPELVAGWKEIAGVVAVIIGFSTIMSGVMAWRGSSRTFVTGVLSDESLVRTLTTECGILGLLFVYLHWRGWRAADFQIKPGWISSGIALLLLPAMAMANSITVLTGFIVSWALQSDHSSFANFIIANSPKMEAHSVHLGWLAMIAALVFNGFFEEITTMGYTFNQLAAKRGPLFALIVVVALRMSCHSYQGIVHMLGIGAVFTVSGLVYWWTRNLWPLILAHILVDFASVSAIKLLYG